MKIQNHTHYRTDDLRKFFLRGLKAEGVSKESYLIRVAYLQVYLGRGGLGYKWIGMYLPKDNLNIKRMAQTFVHEIGHNQNLRHKEMVPATSIDVSWADGLVIGKKEPKIKTKKDIKEKRQVHALKMLTKHRGKLKREQKLVKKWRRKVKYYQKSLAKAALKGEGNESHGKSKDED